MVNYVQEFLSAKKWCQPANLTNLVAINAPKESGRRWEAALRPRKHCGSMWQKFRWKFMGYQFHNFEALINQLHTALSLLTWHHWVSCIHHCMEINGHFLFHIPLWIPFQGWIRKGWALTVEASHPHPHPPHHSHPSYFYHSHPSYFYPILDHHEPRPSICFKKQTNFSL